MNTLGSPGIILLKIILAGVAFIAVGFGHVWAQSKTNLSTRAPDLDPAYQSCPGNFMQSPIDIEGTDPVIAHELFLDYRLSDLTLRHGSHGLMIPYKEGSFLKINTKQYLLETIHFKTPSEHLILSQRFPMEIQFHHVGPQGQKAVIAALVQSGAPHPAIEELWPYLPIEKGQSNVQENVVYNARDLLPYNLDYFRYQGSLTMPPCDDNVAWYILKTPLVLSDIQIDAAKTIQGLNARGVQDRDFRMILDSAR